MQCMYASLLNLVRIFPHALAYFLYVVVSVFLFSIALMWEVITVSRISSSSVKLLCARFGSDLTIPASVTFPPLDLPNYTN